MRASVFIAASSLLLATSAWAGLQNQSAQAMLQQASSNYLCPQMGAQNNQRSFLPSSQRPQDLCQPGEPWATCVNRRFQGNTPKGP